jgi:hypothetical protein
MAKPRIHCRPHTAKVGETIPIELCPLHARVSAANSTVYVSITWLVRRRRGGIWHGEPVQDQPYTKLADPYLFVPPTAGDYTVSIMAYDRADNGVVTPAGRAPRYACHTVSFTAL